MTQKREIPACTICLVVVALSCNVCVLVGNLSTSASFVEMGKSTHGWSHVGLAMARSFEEELGTVMNDVTIFLTKTVGDINEVTKEVDNMLMYVGRAIDAIFLDVAHKSVRIAGSNQTSQTAPTVYQEVKRAAIAGVRDFIRGEVQAVNRLLEKLIAEATPSLLQIGKWETSFGTKLQQDITQFGTTVDWVQKVFDEIMAGLKGGNTALLDYMLFNTFNLFDPQANDCITEKVMVGSATMYGITALTGTKGEQLFHQYAGKDGCIDKQEYANLVTDPGLHGILGTVLRTYAEDLAAVAGSLGQARLRDEVVNSVVKYLQLESAKNHTKVEWIAERLTNGSLPMAFTACVLRELAIQSTNPNVLTTINVGALVVHVMVHQNKPYTLESFKMLSNSSFWVSQGFIPEGIKAVVSTIGGWIQEALNETEDVTTLRHRHILRKKTPADDIEMVFSEGIRDAMSLKGMMQKMSMGAEVGVYQFQRQIHEEQMERRVKLFESVGSKHLFDTFLGGKTMSNGNYLDGLNPTEWHCLHSGVPAVPSTMQFAKQLALNCSRDSNMFLHKVFEYTSSSSNQLDAFANSIRSFVVKVQSFLSTIKKYSGPKGIAYLESEFMNFVRGAEDALVGAIEPAIDNLIRAVIDKVQQLGIPLDPEKILADVEADLEHYIIDPIFDPKFNRTNRLSYGHLVLFQDIGVLLGNLMALLPAAVTIIKDARAEVSTVAQTLNAIFDVFATKGPELFDDIAHVYKILWIVYFICLVPVAIGILWYGMWASGLCGGPEPTEQEDSEPSEQDDAPPHTKVRKPRQGWVSSLIGGTQPTEQEDSKSAEQENVPPPKTFGEKIRTCCTACAGCCTQAHDSLLCFWSCIIIFQIVVVVVFIVAMVLNLLAGIKAFIGAACDQIYMLNEANVCFNVLKSVKNFIPSFIVDPLVPLEDTCTEKRLLLCQLIGTKMIKSVILTTAFSFVSAICQFQLVVQSAVLHEKAVGRRVIANQKLEAD